MKYIEKKTTSSIYQEINSGLRLPYLTICPSYNKPKDDGPLGKFPHFLADKASKNVTNVTESEIEDYWFDNTFDARDGMSNRSFHYKNIYLEVLLPFTFAVLSLVKVNGKKIGLPYGSLINDTAVHNVSVTEKWVGWGRCYMIDWTNTTERLDQVLVVMKHEKSYKPIGNLVVMINFQFFHQFHIIRHVFDRLPTPTRPLLQQVGQPDLRHKSPGWRQI